MRNCADYDLHDGRFKTKTFTSIQLGEVRNVSESLTKAKANLATFRPKVREYVSGVLKKPLSP